MDRVAGSFARVEGLQGADEYLDLLDRVLLDRKISGPERRALDGMAASLGLSEADVARLNRHYMLGVVEAVLARAAGLVSRVGSDVELRPGDLVVLTGMSEARKRELTAVAEARGLVVWPSVKRGVVAVIAQDPGSGSGKARKAREYGITVVGEGVLR